MQRYAIGTMTSYARRKFDSTIVSFHYAYSFHYISSCHPIAQNSYTIHPLIAYTTSKLIVTVKMIQISKYHHEQERLCQADCLKNISYSHCSPRVSYLDCCCRVCQLLRVHIFQTLLGSLKISYAYAQDEYGMVTQYVNV